MLGTIKDNKGNMYHGYVLWQHGTYFVFGFRVNGRNYIWDCNLDYWNLIIGGVTFGTSMLQRGTNTLVRE